MSPNSSIDEQAAVKILVAEDDKTTGFLLTRALQEYGYLVECTNNGQECLDKFSTLQPDIVLLDGMMPVMDGFTCCQRLRSLPQNIYLPILMITFLDDQASIEKAFQVGATDYVTKPVHWTSLRRRIKNLVRTQKLAQQVEQLQSTLGNQQNWYGLWSQSLHLITRFSPNSATLEALLQQFLKGLDLAQLVIVERNPPKVIIARPTEHSLSEALAALPVGTYTALLQHPWPQTSVIDIHDQSPDLKPILAPILDNGSLDLVVQPLLFQEENLGILLAHSSPQAEGWPEITLQRLRDLGSLLAIFLQQGRV